MTTEFAKLSESLTVAEALDELRRQAEELETIYYIYIVDEQDHLRGLVSARELVSSMGKPETQLGELMETGLVSAEADDDQEEVAQKVARYDLLAIPVVDVQRKMLGIITYDDVIDVVKEEAIEDAHRSVAVTPLDEEYLAVKLPTLVWKRGVWLAVLFFAALLTCVALQFFEDDVQSKFPWLMLFVPLIVSCGGNTGNQSATLIITALTNDQLTPNDWSRILKRELVIGAALGLILGLISLACVFVLREEARTLHSVWVVPATILLIMVLGAVIGAALPLLFSRMGLDPALMSNPFVAGIIDIVGIVLYMYVALALL